MPNDNLKGDCSIQITLAPEIENILTEYAVRQNISPELLVQNVLKEWFGSRIVSESSDRNKTLADYFADHIGVFSGSEYVSGGAQMSKNCSKKFAAGLLKSDNRGGYDTYRYETPWLRCRIEMMPHTKSVC